MSCTVLSMEGKGEGEVPAMAGCLRVWRSIEAKRRNDIYFSLSRPLIKNNTSILRANYCKQARIELTVK